MASTLEKILDVVTFKPGYHEIRNAYVKIYGVEPSEEVWDKLYETYTKNLSICLKYFDKKTLKKIAKYMNYLIGYPIVKYDGSTDTLGPDATVAAFYLQNLLNYPGPRNGLITPKFFLFLSKKYKEKREGKNIKNSNHHKFLGITYTDKIKINVPWKLLIIALSSAVAAYIIYKYREKIFSTQNISKLKEYSQIIKEKAKEKITGLSGKFIKK